MDNGYRPTEKRPELPMPNPKTITAEEARKQSEIHYQKIHENQIKEEISIVMEGIKSCIDNGKFFYDIPYTYGMFPSYLDEKTKEYFQNLGYEIIEKYKKIENSDEKNRIYIGTTIKW